MILETEVIVNDNLAEKEYREPDIIFRPIQIDLSNVDLFFQAGSILDNEPLPGVCTVFLKSGEEFNIKISYQALSKLMERIRGKAFPVKELLNAL